MRGNTSSTIAFIQAIQNAGIVTGTINITNNNIGDATAGAYTCTGAPTSNMFGIVNTNGSATATLNITGNTIRGFSFVTCGGVNPINVQGTSCNIVNITNNNLGVAVAAGGIVTYSGAQTAALTGIGNSVANTGGTININNNNIRGITFPASSTSAAVTGISQSGNWGLAGTININNNNLGTGNNGSTGAIVTYNATQSGAFTGITNTGGTTSALSISGNNIQGIAYNIAATASNTYVSNTAASQTENFSSNVFNTLNVNTTGTCTFFSNSVTIPGTGSCVFNNNFIATSYTRGGAIGSIFLTTTNALSSTGSVNNYTNNNFSNITISGTTSIIGFNNTDGGLGSTKTITGNIFNNWTAGTGTINAMNFTYWNGVSSLSSNTITNINAQGAITAVTMGSTSSSANSIAVSGNTITNLISTGAGGAVTGITCANSSPSISISGNTINTLSSTGASSTIVGVNVTGASSTNVFGNTINTLTGSGITSPVANGIAVSGGTLVSLYKNRIYDISQSGAIVTISPAINGILISGGTTVNTYNNLVGDLRAPSAGLTEAIRGISITSVTAGTTQNVFYNTVYLNATSAGVNFGTTGLFHAASATATTATLNLRNNIIYNNSTPNGTGLTVAYLRSAGTAGTLANYGVASNNNDFYSGTPGATRLIYSDGISTAQTLPLYKAGVFTAGTVAPRDVFSFSDAFAPASFFQTVVGSSPNFLKYLIGTALQVESGAQNIATYTDDNSGTVRFGNAGYISCVPASSAPDVGAWELCGIASDQTAPAISYTNLNNSSCTSFRVFSPVTITDPSGVNVTIGTKPRVYYKKFTDVNTFLGNTNGTGGWKYVEATNATSPFSFTIDYSLIQIPVALGDVIQYFVVAADLVGPTANVGINAGTFVGATPTTVDLQAAGVISIGGIPASYTITIAGLSGTVTIGAAGTYTSITGAGGLFAALNAGGLTGNVIANIIDPVVAETGAVALNQLVYGCAPSFTLTIKPQTVATLSGALASGALLNLNGASNVIIDGSNSGGTDRSLTIKNTSTTSPIVLAVASLGTTSISNVTVKNCILINGVNTSSALVVSDAGTLGNPGYFTNITIQNNSVQLAYIGIYCNAAVSVGNGNGLTINGNDLTTSGANSIRYTGIYVQGASGATVSNNLLANFDGTANEDDKGIWFATGTSNSSIWGNKVTNLNYTGIGGYGGNGIYISTGVTLAAIKVYNNMIANLSGDGWNYTTLPTDNPIGIVLTSSQTGIEVYFNSINLYGNTLNQSSALSMGIFLNTGSVANIRDNIINNNLGLLGATGLGSCAIYAATNNAQFAASDYNDYYVNPTGSGVKYIGQIVAAGSTTLAAWQAATLQDVNSLNVQPNFTAPTDLHLVNTTNCGLDGYGTPIAGFTTDYDGQTRDASTPDMGMDEFTATYGATLAGIAGFAVCENKTVSVTGTTFATGSCSLIARVLPSGGAAVSGKVNTCVTLNATQQYFNAAPYVQRHFDIEPLTANTTTTSATITLFFTDAEFQLYNATNPVWPKLPTQILGNLDPNIANVKVTQYHGTPFTTPSQPGLYTANAGAGVFLVPTLVFWNGLYWAVTVNITGFSGLYVYTSYYAAPLPITVNYFRGTRQGTSHLLDWKVTCNTSPKVTMTLERSENAAGPFAGINIILADALRCSQPFNYTDANPLPGMNYYRLKMVDADGKISYSGIVALLNAVKGFELVNIAPNPVSSNGMFKLHISSAQLTKLDLVLTDLQGRVVKRQTVAVIAGFNSIDLNVAELSAGTYSISAIVAGEKTRVVRFVKL